ncbi:MAG: hypothetical protein FJ146_14770 [Deltaproteobacteria bacterium]|nr:hypothetical protein [Deltaproteobacteria bacterium]
MILSTRFRQFTAGAVVAVAAWSYSCPSYAEAIFSVFSSSKSTSVVYNLSDGSNSTKIVNGQEYGVIFGYKPWHKIPASFGLMTTYYALNTGSVATAIAEDDLGDSLKFFGVSGSGSLSGLLYGPHLTLWYPSHYVQPYLRVGMLMGEEENSLRSDAATLGNVSPARSIKGQHIDTFEVNANFISIGFSMSPIRILRLNHDPNFPVVATEHHVYTFALFGEYATEMGTRTLIATSRSRASTMDNTTTTTDASRISAKELIDQDAQATSIRFGIEYRF